MVQDERLFVFFCQSRFYWLYATQPIAAVHLLRTQTRRRQLLIRLASLTAVIIDEEVIKACRMYLRGACGDSLDQMQGSNYQVTCWPYLLYFDYKLWFLSSVLSLKKFSRASIVVFLSLLKLIFVVCTGHFFLCGMHH